MDKCLCIQFRHCFELQLYLHSPTLKIVQPDNTSKKEILFFLFILLMFCIFLNFGYTKIEGCDDILIFPFLAKLATALN